MILFLLLSCANTNLLSKRKGLEEALRLFKEKDHRNAIFELESSEEAQEFFLKGATYFRKPENIPLLFHNGTPLFLSYIFKDKTLQEIEKIILQHPLDWLKNRYESLEEKSFKDLSVYVCPVVALISSCPHEEKCKEFIATQSKYIINEYFRQDLSNLSDQLAIGILFFLSKLNDPEKESQFSSIRADVSLKKKMRYLLSVLNEGESIEDDVEDEEDRNVLEFIRPLKKLVVDFIKTLEYGEKVIFCKSINKTFTIKELYDLIYSSECNIDILNFRSLLLYVELSIINKQFDEERFKNALSFLADIMDSETLSFEFIENSENNLLQELIIEGQLQEAMNFIIRASKDWDYKKKVEEFLDLSSVISLKNTVEILEEREIFFYTPIHKSKISFEEILNLLIDIDIFDKSKSIEEIKACLTRAIAQLEANRPEQKCELYDLARQYLIFAELDESKSSELLRISDTRKI